MANKDNKIVGLEHGMIWKPKHARDNYAISQEKQQQHYMMQNLQAQDQWHNSNLMQNLEAQDQWHNSNLDCRMQRTRLSSPTFEASGEHSNRAQVDTMILDPTTGSSNIGTGVFIPKIHKASSRRRRKLAGMNAYYSKKNIDWGSDNLDDENDNQKGANDAQLDKFDSPEILLPEEWNYDIYG